MITTFEISAATGNFTITLPYFILESEEFKLSIPVNQKGSNMVIVNGCKAYALNPGETLIANNEGITILKP